jgi:hypothetical protein
LSLVDIALVDSAGQVAEAQTQFMVKEFGGSKIAAGPPTFLGSGQLSKIIELPLGANLDANTDFWAEIQTITNGPATFSGRMVAELISLPREAWVAAT